MEKALELVPAAVDNLLLVEMDIQGKEKSLEVQYEELGVVWLVVAVRVVERKPLQPVGKVRFVVALVMALVQR